MRTVIRKLLFCGVLRRGREGGREGEQLVIIECRNNNMWGKQLFAGQ
jgi:hypothetical protein